MSEARIGRVVAAALHEALAGHLPLRLEFYESYLRPMGMRAGTIGVASFSAALSFLRADDNAYETVVRAAGRLAAEWMFEDVAPVRRALWARLPETVRQRAALRLTAQLVASTVGGARGRLVGRGTDRHLVITGSPFCEARQLADAPRCGFYAAALGRFCELLGLGATGAIGACRAEGAPACSLGLGPADAAAAIVGQGASRILS
jgi:hypothetical protein